jgi:hypothetical protein
MTATIQNPVFYDSTLNVHRPMDAGAVVPTAAVPLSVLTVGNRIQALSDGIYVGDYSGYILYVDSVNGLDTNNGTKATPFKTIDHAFTYLTSLFPNGYYAGHNIAIALKAGQSYPWTTTFEMAGDCDLKITFYGDANYGDFNGPAIGTGANPWNMSNLARPNLMPVSSVQQPSGLQQIAGINRRGGTIAFMGVTITLPAAPSVGAPISAYSGYCDVVRSLSPVLGIPLGDDGGVHLIGSVVNMSDITAYWGFMGTFARATVRFSQFCSQFQVQGLLMNAANAPTTAQLTAREYFIKFLSDAPGNSTVISLAANSSNSSAGSGMVYAMWSEAQALVVTGTTTNLASYPLSFDPGYGLVNYIFGLSKTANGQSLNFLNTRLF